MGKYICDKCGREFLANLDGECFSGCGGKLAEMPKEKRE